MPDVTPKCRSITVLDTTSEARPTAVVAEVSIHATAIAQTVRRPAAPTVPGLVLLRVHFVAIALNQVRGIADPDDDQQGYDDVVEDVHRLAEERHAADCHQRRNRDGAQRQEHTGQPAERQRQSRIEADQHGQRDQAEGCPERILLTMTLRR